MNSIDFIRMQSTTAVRAPAILGIGKESKILHVYE